MTRKVLAALVAALLGGCAAHVPPPPPAEARGSELRELAALGDLTAAFDRDRAHPRVVLLLSPT